jgi:hypothetical protein
MRQRDEREECKDARPDEASDRILPVSTFGGVLTSAKINRLTMNRPRKLRAIMP